MRPMRAHAIVLAAVIAGCHAAPATHAPDVLVVGGAAARQPAPIAREVPGSFFVGGCNVECVGCAAIDAGTYVVGTMAGQTEPLFAGPPSPGAAYSCSAQVPVGQTIVLRAHGSSAFEFVGWRNHQLGAGDYCPCAGSADPVCAITVDADVAASYGRAYCGARWRPRGAAVLAR